jgi:hypothetical protein
MKFPILPREQVCLYPELATGLWRVDVQLEPNGPWYGYTREPTREGAQESYDVLTGKKAAGERTGLKGEKRGNAEVKPTANTRTARAKTAWNWR